jgi:cell division septum initiation protein DivIVA
LDSEQYEILPHEELEALRKEVEFLKTNPLGETKQADSLKASIDQLTEGIHALMNLLSNVNKDMTEDYKNMTVENHFSHLSQQNQTIAQGILSVAELVKKYHKEDREELAKKFEDEAMNSVPDVNKTGGNSPISSMNPGLAQPQQQNQNNQYQGGQMPPMPQPPSPMDQNQGQQQNNQQAPPPPNQNNKQGEDHKKKGLFRFS